MKEFQQRLGHQFAHPNYLENAVTHSSYANEMRGRFHSNERLEFLGDSVLGFVTAEFLFARHPDLDGGALYRRLKELGVLVRHFDAPRIADYNRITVGSREQMDRLLEALRAILKEGL